MSPSGVRQIRHWDKTAEPLTLFNERGGRTNFTGNQRVFFSGVGKKGGESVPPLPN